MNVTRTSGSAVVVANSALLDRERPRPGEDLPGGQTAVLDHQPPTLLVATLPVIVDKRLDFGIDCLLKHLPGSLTHQFIQRAALAELLSKRDYFRIEWLLYWRYASVCLSLIHGVS